MNYALDSEQQCAVLEKPKWLPNHLVHQSTIMSSNKFIALAEGSEFTQSLCRARATHQNIPTVWTPSYTSQAAVISLIGVQQSKINVIKD